MSIEILTVADVARELKCCSRTVTRKIESGKLRAFDVGTGDRKHHWRVHRADLDAYVEQRATRPRDTSAPVRPVAVIPARGRRRSGRPVGHLAVADLEAVK